MTSPRTTVRETVTRLDDAITELTERLRRATQQVAELEAAKVKPPSPPRRAPRGTVPPTVPLALGAYHLGDRGPTAQLNETVAALCSLRPMTRAELVEITGARTNRVAGAIVWLQRGGHPEAELIPIGNKPVAWYLRKR